MVVCFDVRLQMITRLKPTTGDRRYAARVSHGTAHVIARYTKPIPQEWEWVWFRDIPWNFVVYYAIQLRNIVACISCWQELRLDSHTQPSLPTQKVHIRTCSICTHVFTCISTHIIKHITYIKLLLSNGCVQKQKGKAWSILSHEWCHAVSTKVDRGRERGSIRKDAFHACILHV